jgi:hypothetical protein
LLGDGGKDIRIIFNNQDRSLLGHFFHRYDLKFIRGLILSPGSFNITAFSF